MSVATTSTDTMASTPTTTNATATATTTTTNTNPHQLLALISSLGVPVASQYPATVPTLEAKLGNLLDESQRLPQYIGETSSVLTNPALHPSNLHIWSSSTHGCVEDAMARGLVAPFATSNRVQDFPCAFPHKSLFGKHHATEETFVELRQTLAQLGAFWDEGKRVVLLQDEEQTSAIALRMTSVLTLPLRPSPASSNPPLPSSTTLLTLLFQHSTREKPLLSSVRFLKRHRIKLKPTERLPQIVSSATEQKLLLRLLRRNRETFGGDSLKGLVKREEDEEDFEVGVALPVYPLPLETVAEYGKEFCGGCISCGGSGTGTMNRCSSCHAVSYCSPTCQKQDWKNHKHLCKSLKGGKWVSVPISLGASPSLPNVHASWPFVLKVEDTSPASAPAQSPSPEDEDAEQAVVSIRLTDRSQSLTFSLSTETNADIDFNAFFEAAPAELGTQPSEPTEAKIEEITEEKAKAFGDKQEEAKRRCVYRWSRRVSASTVEICVDREVEKSVVGDGW